MVKEKVANKSFKIVVFALLIFGLGGIAFAQGGGGGTGSSANCVSGPHTIKATDHPYQSSAWIDPPYGCTGPVQSITVYKGSATSKTKTCHWTYGHNDNGSLQPEFGFRFRRQNWAASRWDDLFQKEVLYFTDGDYRDNTGSCEVKLTWKKDNSLPNFPLPVPQDPNPNNPSYSIEVVPVSPSPYEVGKPVDFFANPRKDSDPTNANPFGYADWTWYFGDNSTGYQGQVVNSSQSHVFTKAGTYTIKARAVNDQIPIQALHYPGVSGQTEIKVSEPQDRNYEIKLIVLPDQETYAANTKISFVAYVQDQNQNPPGLMLNWVWSWDTNVTGANRYDQGIGDNWTYKKEGQYTLKIRAHNQAVPLDLSVSRTFKIGANTPNTPPVPDQNPPSPPPSPDCQPPAGSVSDPIQILNNLNNYKPVKIAANDLSSWINKNRPDIDDWLINAQYCQNLGMGNPGDKMNSVVSSLKKQLSKNIKTNNPVVIPFAIVAPSGKLYGFHDMVGLKFEQTNKLLGSLAKYKLTVLDPNEHQVRTLECSQFQSPELPGTLVPYLGCKTGGAYEGDTLVVINISRLKITDYDSLIKNKVRKNPAEFLQNNPLPINNDEPQYLEGVCAAWSKMAVSLAYLAEFVGECQKPTSILPFSDQLAAPGFLNLLQLLFFPFNLQPSNQ